MSEMVRRVCDAIDGAFSQSDLSWEKCARAAIEAMRNPPKSVLREALGASCSGDPWAEDYPIIWHAIIDAALDEKAEKAK